MDFHLTHTNQFLIQAILYLKWIISLNYEVINYPGFISWFVTGDKSEQWVVDF